MRKRIGIVGAAGFAGIELVRRALQHPNFELAYITSDADAVKRLDAVYPAFAGASDLVFSAHADADLESCDAVFLAVPHTAAMAVVPGLLEAGVSVFDLSADYRLKDAAVFEQWYGTPHTSPELLARAAFGQPETCAGELARAAADYAAGTPALVACAGCYPTATSLAAWPAVSAGWVEGVVVANAISGVTGAGRKPGERTHFCSANENVEAYGVATHRHTPEIEQILGLQGRLVFTPHLAPLNRGLLSTVSMQLTEEAAQGFSVEAAREHYRAAYAGSPFVQVLDSMPKTASVVGTNNAHVGLAYAPATRTLIGVGAIDNLCKGAASQAVQCANIVFGLPQDAGLGALGNPV